MSFLKTKVDSSTLQDQGTGSKYISKSGIYDVVLKVVSVDVGAKGSTSLNFNVEDADGNPTTFYGLRLTNNDGSENFQAALAHKLAVIANLEEINDPEEQTHNMGKDNKPTNLMVLDDFTDFECKIRVQEEYSISKGGKNDGKIRKSMAIKNFYRAGDGASAQEIASEAAGTPVEVGTQLGKDEAYASNVTYKDGLTEESVKEWKDSFKSGGNAGGATTASQPSTVNKPAGSLFKR